MFSDEYTGRARVNRPSPPASSVPATVAADETESDAEVTLPDEDRLDAVTAVAVNGPELIPDAVMAVELVMPATVRAEAERTELTVTSPAVNAPDNEALTPVIAPNCAMDAVTAVAVNVPEADKSVLRSRPVTEAVLATRPPRTVTVRVGDEPMTTAAEAAPSRTVPADKPVPASRTRSPPALPESPLA